MARKRKIEQPPALGLPKDYAEFLESLKGRVRRAQTKAILAVNRELIQLYWDLGKRIAERQETEGWGKGVVDRLARDLQKAFPGIGGFSPSNVSRMRAFYLAYAKPEEFSAQPVPKLGRGKEAPKKSAQAVPKSPGEKGVPHEPASPGPSDQPPTPLGEIPWGHNPGPSGRWRGGLLP